MGEIKITISLGGEIQVEVSGVKGSKCTDLTKWIESIGEVTEQKKTKEYYEVEKQKQEVKLSG